MYRLSIVPGNRYVHFYAAHLSCLCARDCSQIAANDSHSLEQVCFRLQSNRTQRPVESAPLWVREPDPKQTHARARANSDFAANGVSPGQLSSGQLWFFPVHLGSRVGSAWRPDGEWRKSCVRQPDHCQTEHVTQNQPMDTDTDLARVVREIPALSSPRTPAGGSHQFLRASSDESREIDFRIRKRGKLSLVDMIEPCSVLNAAALSALSHCAAVSVARTADC